MESKQKESVEIANADVQTELTKYVDSEATLASQKAQTDAWTERQKTLDGDREERC